MQVSFGDIDKAFLSVVNHESFDIHGKRWFGSYYPAYNWIMLLDREERTIETLEHEYFHAYSMGLYPAHLFTLYNTICDICNEPRSEVSISNSRDIIESVYIVFQRLKGYINSFDEIRSYPEYIPICHELWELIEDLIKYCDNDLKDNIKYEAYYALLTILNKTIPNNSNNGYNIIKLFRKHMIKNKWRNRYDLEPILFKQYSKLNKHNKEAKALYQLIYPENVHRLIGELLLFIRVLSISIQNNKIITPTLLSLINLFSLGCLVIIPQYYIKKDKISLDVLHSNENGSKISELINNIDNYIAKSIHKYCYSVILYKEILIMSRNYMLIKDSKRLKRFMENFIIYFVNKINNINSDDIDCEHCRNMYEYLIKPYSNIIIGGLSNHINAVIHSFDKYDEWIKGEGVLIWIKRQMEKNNIKIDSNEIECKYQYL